MPAHPAAAADAHSEVKDANNLAVFVVGEYLGEASTGDMAWAMHAVMLDRSSAERLCTSPNYFVGAVCLGTPLDKPYAWDLVYPFNAQG